MSDVYLVYFDNSPRADVAPSEGGYEEGADDFNFGGNAPASTNLTIIDDDDVYELLGVMVWLSSHELLLSPEIFDLWAVEDSHGGATHTQKNRRSHRNKWI